MNWRSPGVLPICMEEKRSYSHRWNVVKERILLDNEIKLKGREKIHHAVHVVAVSEI